MGRAGHLAHGGSMDPTLPPAPRRLPPDPEIRTTTGSDRTRSVRVAAPPERPSSPPLPPRDDRLRPSPDDGDDPDRSRAGAIWVTGTGAFLLLASAAVFVAVRWEHLDDQVKLAILVALTGGFLLAGRRFRRAIPATAGVLFHLGALLVPVDIAAFAVNVGLPVSQLLLLTGSTAAGSWFLLDRADPSVVMRWAAATASIVALAGGAAVVGLPAPLVLAVAALVAAIWRSPNLALGWAAVAGAGPVIVFAERVWTSPWIGSTSTTSITGAIGSSTSVPSGSWALSGTIAALVMGWVARRRGEVILLVPATASLAIGVTATWTILDPGVEAGLLGVSATFLLIEVVAALVRRDPFWARPARVASWVVEALTAATIPGLVVATTWWTLDESILDPRRTTLTAAAVLGALAWLAGDVGRIAGEPRRTGAVRSIALGSGWWPATPGIVSMGLVAVALGTGSSMAVAIAMAAVSAAVVLTGRPGGHAVAAALTITAPLVASFDLVVNRGWRGPGAFAWSTITASEHHLAVIGVSVLAIAGALVLAGAASIRAHLPDASTNAPLAWLLAVASIGPVAMAVVVLAGHLPNLALLIGAAVTLWAVAVVLDRGGRVAHGSGIAGLGWAAQLGMLATLLGSDLIGVRGTVVLAGVLVGLQLTDAARRRSEVPLVGLAVTVPVLVGTICADAGLSGPQTGLALTMLAAVAAGMHLLIGGRRGWPAVGVVAASAASGLVLAAGTAATGWSAVLVLAGIGLAYAVVHHSAPAAWISGVAAVVATWGLLADGGVDASDAYLAPVALLLVVGGASARRSSTVSSWVAYAPAILALGGSALVERIDGGSGVHALVAGAVAARALILGGARRLASPLMLGTMLVVALTVHESLAVTRQVPTWGWLALGGSLLVAAGIVMERRDTSPLETGRRLVDVVGTRFS